MNVSPAARGLPPSHKHLLRPLWHQAVFKQSALSFFATSASSRASISLVLSAARVFLGAGNIVLHLPFLGCFVRNKIVFRKGTPAWNFEVKIMKDRSYPGSFAGLPSRTGQYKQDVSLISTSFVR